MNTLGSRAMTRRQFVIGTGAASAAAALAACTSATPPAPTTAPPASATAPAASATAPAAAAAAPAASGGLTLPTTAAKLPTDPVTLHWADNAGLKAIFFQDFLPAYQKAHPNVTVNYDGLPLPELAK